MWYAWFDGAWYATNFIVLVFPDLCDTVEDFKRGAVLAGFPNGVEMVEELTPEELTALHDEKTNRWKQPWQIYYVAIISSMAAVVQGMEYVVSLR